MKTVAVVDLSWDMHRNKEALKMLSVERKLPSGQTLTVPTGHVYGTLQDVKVLSQNYDLVVLAVDSPCHKRKELLASYKADRHTATGDAFTDYNIFNDLRAVLSLCTSLYINVFYVKENEMEADDIIASFMLNSNSSLDREYSIYMRDKDILQTKARYVWYDGFNRPPVDRVSYIQKSTGLMSEFDYFPLPVKVITGDASDRIPNRIPRFPKQCLDAVCMGVASDNYSFEPIISALKVVRDTMSKAWQDKLSGLNDPESDLYKGLYLNYQMVVPIHKPVDQFKYKQLRVDNPVELQNLFESYQINSEKFL